MLATPMTAGPVVNFIDTPPTESATVLCASQNRSGTHCTTSLSSHPNLPAVAGADLMSIARSAVRLSATGALNLTPTGGLPSSPIREVRTKNDRVGPPPLGGWEVAGRRAGPGSGPPVLVRRVVSRLRLGSAWVLPFRLSGEVASSRASSGYGYLTQCTRQSQA